MLNKHTFLLGLLYKSIVKEMIVANVCADVYLSGYLNGLDDVMKRSKKTFVCNIGNMVGSTCTGAVKGLLFPVYFPGVALYLSLYHERL
jgi:hypothetical protein